MHVCILGIVENIIRYWYRANAEIRGAVGKSHSRSIYLVISSIGGEELDGTSKSVIGKRGPCSCGLGSSSSGAQGRAQTLCRVLVPFWMLFLCAVLRS